MEGVIGSLMDNEGGLRSKLLHLYFYTPTLTYVSGSRAIPRPQLPKSPGLLFCHRLR